MTAWGGELARLKNTVIWSWQGWRAAWASEASLRHWTRMQAASVALACLIPMSAGERALIIGLGFVLLAAELMNTAVEVVVDMLSDSPHPLAGKAKDCASAAVALTAIAAGAAWLVVLVG